MVRPDGDSSALVANGLHVSRFGTYMVAAGGDQTKALALYEWNLQLAGALFETLILTEVFLRNSMDTQLRIWNGKQRDRISGLVHSAEWTIDPATPLRAYAKSALSGAKRSAEKAKKHRPDDHPRKTAPICHDDLVAQLTFGAYARLLPTPDAADTGYAQRQILWREALVGAFPHRHEDTEGYITGGRAERLAALRNRVAHAEPLLDVMPRNRLGDVGRLLSSIDPEISSWVTGRSRVAEIAKRRPS